MKHRVGASRLPANRHYALPLPEQPMHQPDASVLDIQFDGNRGGGSGGWSTSEVQEMHSAFRALHERAAIGVEVADGTMH